MPPFECGLAGHLALLPVGIGADATLRLRHELLRLFDLAVEPPDGALGNGLRENT